MVSRPLTAELVPRGMAQEILSGQSLRLLGGSRFVGQLAERYPPGAWPALAQVVSQTPLAAFFWHKEIEAPLNDIVENGTAQACSRWRFPGRRHGPCWACFSLLSAGTTRTAR
jgi:metal-dependent amidase/aminoacylase/carboxypeptidase family protein